MLSPGWSDVLCGRWCDCVRGGMCRRPHGRGWILLGGTGYVTACSEKWDLRVNSLRSHLGNHWSCPVKEDFVPAYNGPLYNSISHSHCLRTKSQIHTCRYIPKYRNTHTHVNLPLCGSSTCECANICGMSCIPNNLFLVVKTSFVEHPSISL